MSLKDRIAGDLKAAMKSGDKTRLETLRTMRAVLLEKEIEKRGTEGGMTPDDEVAALTGAAKRRRESIEMFEKGGRMDLVAQEKEELEIVLEYLPQQLSEEEIAPVIKRLIGQTGAATPQDIGKVMSLAMRELKGKADGRLVQQIVRKLLASG
jgi:uncharacterized protein YqeY